MTKTKIAIEGITRRGVGLISVSRTSPRWLRGRKPWGGKVKWGPARSEKAARAFEAIYPKLQKMVCGSEVVVTAFRPSGEQRRGPCYITAFQQSLTGNGVMVLEAMFLGAGPLTRVRRRR